MHSFFKIIFDSIRYTPMKFSSTYPMNVNHASNDDKKYIFSSLLTS